MSDHLFILTGAGISAESGIPTFRDANGLWQNHDIMAVASPEGFARNPALVQTFYNQRRAQLCGIEPNAAHFALARLQRGYCGQITLVTQNIDDLHERAGAHVLHMHGELMKARCLRCLQSMPWKTDIDADSACIRCGGGLRPHVVWFGEMPHYLDEIEAALTATTDFVAIGTSAEVYPAASFAELAKAAGARTLEINLQPTVAHFDARLAGPATREVPAWVDDLLAAIGRR